MNTKIKPPALVRIKGQTEIFQLLSIYFPSWWMRHDGWHGLVALIVGASGTKTVEYNKLQKVKGAMKMARDEAASELALALHNYDPTGIESLQEDAAIIKAAMLKREKPLIGMLRNLQWSNITLEGFGHCPTCGHKEDGHEITCELDALLKEYEL